MYEKDLNLTKLAWNHSENEPTYSSYLKGGGQSLSLQKPSQSKKMKFCYIDKFEDYPLSKPVKVALETTIETLKRNGHKVERIDVEKWQNPTWKFYLENNMRITSHMIRNTKELLDKNILSKECFLLNIFLNMPCFVSSLLLKTMNFLGCKKEAEKLKIFLTVDNGKTIMQRVGWWESFRSKMYNLMRMGEYDCLLLPGGLVPAYPVGKSRNYTFLQEIFQLPNTLKMCAGCVPIRKVEKDEELYITDQSNLHTKAIINCLKNSRGLPVGVQVCALQFEEEKCLKAMVEIQR